MPSESSRKRTVWLTNEGGHDYSDLSRFGEVQPLTRYNVNPFAVDRLAVNIGHKLQVAHEEDFLAISGAPIITAIAFHMWLERFGICNLLQWSNRKEMYEWRPVKRDRLAVLSNQNMIQGRTGS